MARRVVLPAMIVLLMLSAVSQAQRPDGRRGRGFFGRRGFGDGVVALAGMKEVQKEIKLSKQQVELLEALQADLWNQRRVAMSPARDESAQRGQGGQRSFEDARKRFEEINKKGEQLLMTVILEDDQALRLGQLDLQRDGTRALERPDMAKALALSEEQLEKIREIRRAGRRRNQPQQRVSIEDFRRRRAMLDGEIVAVLTAEQVDAWSQLKGDEFKFPERRSRFGRSGRQRPEQGDD